MANGGDINELQFNLGHASVKTTEIYLQELGVDINRAKKGISPLEKRARQKIDERLPSAERIRMVQ